MRILRVLALLALVLLAPATAFANVAPASQASPAATNPDDQLFFIGMSGMGISDLDVADPVIRDTLSGLGMAHLTARTRTALTCRNEGWMSLVVDGDVIDAEGRENRRGTSSTCPLFAVNQVGDSGRVNYFERMTSEVSWPDENPFGPDALAIGPGAAIATADSAGISANWRPFPNDVGELTQLFSQARGPVLVDLGSVRAPRTDDESRDVQVAGLNKRLSTALEAYTQAGSPGRLVIASIGDTWNSLQLQAYAIERPDAEGPAVLRTSTTRATGLVTIANLRSEVAGGDRTVTFEQRDSVNDVVAELSDMEDHVYAAGRSTATWYQVFNVLVLVGAVAAVIVFAFRATHQGWWERLAILNTFAFAFVPAALIQNFIPWWRLVADSSPMVTRAVAIGLTALLAGALTYLARRTKHPVAVVAIVAFVVLSVDIVMGSAHQRNGFMGSLVMTSRRYYGISNRTYIILVVAGLLAALPWIRRWLGRADAERRTERAITLRAHHTAAWGVVAIGVIALLVDSVPMWGADFGGPPGIMAGFGLAAVLVAGIRFRWWFVLVWVALTAVTMGIMALIDSRSDSSSHIGGFWSSVGTEDSWTMIQSKIRDVLRSFVGRPDILALIVVVIIVVVVGVIAFRRLARAGSPHVDRLRYAGGGDGTVPIIVGIVVGILVAVPVNDSGALMIKEGLYIALPAIVALLSQRLANAPAESVNEVEPSSQKVLEN